MSRSICLQCSYPVDTCICLAVKQLSVPLTIHILQHPSEQKVAKNTARLIKLVIPQTQLNVGESESDFETLKGQLDATSSLLIYPCEDNQVVIKEGCRAKITLPRDLVLIDATWRKAKKIYALNPWLQQLPSARIEPMGKTRYAIRHSRLEGSLSTIEALMIGLNGITNVDTEPLSRVFQAMVQQQMKFMPKKVRERYSKED